MELVGGSRVLNSEFRAFEGRVNGNESETTSVAPAHRPLFCQLNHTDNTCIKKVSRSVSQSTGRRSYKVQGMVDCQIVR